jgi:hypothetical protein
VLSAGRLQERELRLEPAGDIDKAYYMPTPADGSVRALRKWIAKYGGPKWLVNIPDTLPPKETDRRVGARGGSGWWGGKTEDWMGVS